MGSLFLSDQFAPKLEEIVYYGGAFPLSDHKAFEVTGSDSQTFLNNQTTNNVEALECGCFHLNCVLDISAKLVGFFYLIKKEKNHFYILAHEELYDSVMERLDKYLIAEEVEFNPLSSSPSFVIGTKALGSAPKGFEGIYGGEKAKICFENSSVQALNPEALHFFNTVTGEPVWKETIHDLELVNNTVLVDLAYDKDKGCFLGQETVAKIETRRGAAFKPVLLECDKDISRQPGEVLKKDEKKIGKVLACADNYLLASLNRTSRIEGLEIEIDDPQNASGKVIYLPAYKASDKPESFYHHGVELFQQGNEEDAEKYLLMSIDCDPAYEDPYESLGVLYGRQERYEEAIEYMQKLSKLNQKSVMAHTNMSLYYMKIGEIEKAEEQKSEATIKQFQQLGEEAETKKRLEEAEKRKKEELEKREGMFREVLEIDPEDTLANYGLGEIEYEKGNYEQSIKHLAAAIDAKKNYSVAWLALGKSYLASKNKEKAEETFRQGIEIAGKNGDLMPANEMQRLLGSI